MATAAEKKAEEAKASEKNDDQTAAAMGRSPKGSKAPEGMGYDNDDTGVSASDAVVPAAGHDPDSIQRVMKHLPEDLREDANLGAATPEELSAQRTAYGQAIREVRDGKRPGREELKDLTEEQAASVTGQPIGDGKSTGAPSADDPNADERDQAAVDRAAAGQSKLAGPRNRTSTPRATTK